MPPADPTIAPPQNQRFSLTNVSWLLDTRKGANKKLSPNVLLFAKDYRTMASGGGDKRHRISGDMTGIIGAGFESRRFL